MSIVLNEGRCHESPNVAFGAATNPTRTEMPHNQLSSSAEISELEQPPKGEQQSDDSEALRRINLPGLATANDVREVVQYLKRRPDGVNICDVVQPIKKRIFYPAKVDAYLFWGLVTKHGERLKLAPRGWEFAKSLEPEAEAYRTLLAGTVFYEGALRWINAQGLDLITTDDLVEYWESTFSEGRGVAYQKDVEKSVVSFFHLCQAADLGTMTIGKRGQPARMRIWRAALLECINRLSLTGNRPAADDT